MPSLRYAILDLGRVTSIDPSAATVLCSLISEFADRDRRILFVGVEDHPRFLRELEERLLSSDRLVRPLALPEQDAAVEWCENRLLAQA